MAKTKYPFPFVGEGFGTSYKCLEGYVWFLSAPHKRDHRAIVELLPDPMKVCARVSGDLLHYGSDDALESRVKLRYSKAYRDRPAAEAFEELEALWQKGSDGYVPTRAEWKAFCEDFRACTLRMHARWPIRLALKPDQGEYGLALGAWHDWSLGQLVPIADFGAAQKAKPTRDLSYLAVNLIQSVIEDGPPAAAVAHWLEWLDKLAVQGASDLRSDFVDMIATLLEDAPELEKTLRPAVRKKLAAGAT